MPHPREARVPRTRYRQVFVSQHWCRQNFLLKIAPNSHILPIPPNLPKIFLDPKSLCCYTPTMRRHYLLRRKRARLMQVTHDATPDYTVNQPLTITFEISGGREPYHLELFTGTLPAGLSLDGLTITGTPTVVGSTQISLRVSDLVDTVKPVYLALEIV